MFNWSRLIPNVKTWYLLAKINGSKIWHQTKNWHGINKYMKCAKRSHLQFQALKLARFLPVDALKKLYYSLVGYQLRCCRTVWDNCGKILKNKLRRMQYRAARVVCLTAPEIDDEVALKNLGGLDVQQLIEYNTANLIWKGRSGLALTYISDMFVQVKSVHNHDTRNVDLDFILLRKIWLQVQKVFLILAVRFG